MITQKQIEALKGQAIIEIEKEWRECDCYCHTKHSPERKGKHFGMVSGDFDCPDCNGNGKIPKYQVGDEIKICGCGISIGNNFYQCSCDEKDFIKLKIISETETHWRVMTV